MFTDLFYSLPITWDRKLWKPRLTKWPKLIPFWILTFWNVYHCVKPLAFLSHELLAEEKDKEVGMAAIGNMIFYGETGMTCLTFAFTYILKAEGICSLFHIIKFGKGKSIINKCVKKW